MLQQWDDAAGHPTNAAHFWYFSSRVARGKVYFLEITQHVLEIALESGILLSIFRRFSIPSI
jgi:hypothetical protein